MNNTYFNDLLDSWIASIDVVNTPGMHEELKFTESDVLKLNLLKSIFSKFKE